MGAYTKVTDFIAHVKATGLPTASHYHIILPPLANTNTDSEKTSFLCETASIPGVSLMTNEIRIFGEVTEMPYGIAYPPANFTLIVDNKFTAKHYFDAWSNMVYNRVTRTSGYYNDYKRDIEVVVDDKIGNNIYHIRLRDAYPKAIQDISLSYGNHEVIKLDVAIAFKSWERVNNPAN